jgi:hypothetical protein
MLEEITRVGVLRILWMVIEEEVHNMLDLHLDGWIDR